MPVRTRFFFAAVVVALASCIDGPFARINPHDEAFDLTMEIVSDIDTLTPDRPTAILHVVTQPRVNGYQPRWGAPPDSPVFHSGNGVFRLGVVPASPTQVVVTATFQHITATKTLYVRPTP